MIDLTVLRFCRKKSIIIYFLEHDVDGKILQLMNSVERISQIIPQFKLQLIFLEEREKLFRRSNDNPISHDDSLSVASTTGETPPVVSKLSDSIPIALTTCSSSSFITFDSTSPMNILSQQTSLNKAASNTSGLVKENASSFPEIYKVPPLSNEVVKAIQGGLHRTFGPHCSNRQVVIDAVSFDLIENYKLL